MMKYKTMKEKWQILCGSLLMAIFIPAFAQATTTVSGIVVAAGGTATWTLTDSPYIATGTIEVKGTLTIEPGVQVRFGSATEMKIGSSGTLIAEGTPNGTITFTSHQDVHTKGYWKYIYFDSECVHTSIFKYCHIEYGGGGGGGNIYCETMSSINLTPFILSTCTISYSSANGVCYADYDLIAEIYDCNIKGNEGYPVIVGPMFKMKGNIFSGNISEKIKILPCTYGFKQDITWYNQGIPYLISGSSDLLIGGASGAGTLTIEPGVTVQFEEGRSIGVSDTTLSGCLQAKGTQGAYITFTSSKLIPNLGDWGYIKFDELSQNSCLEYCKIEYAGNNSVGAQPAVWCAGSSPKIDHVDILNVYSHGIMCFQSGGGIPASPTITFSTIIAGTTSSYAATSSAIYSSDSCPFIGSSTLMKSNYGIYNYISGSYGTPTPTIINSNIIGNTKYGVFNNCPSWSVGTISATYNWWGSSTGPFHPGVYEGGGDRVSDCVEYDHWIGTDKISPEAITTLKIKSDGVEAGTVSLEWSPTGDDYTVGTPTYYVIHYATFTIGTEGAWNKAPGSITVFGDLRECAVSSLNANTLYYFSIRAVDEANNRSTLSNCVGTKTKAAFTAPIIGGVQNGNQCVILNIQNIDYSDVGFWVYYGSQTGVSYDTYDGYWDAGIVSGNGGATDTTSLMLSNGKLYYFVAYASDPGNRGNKSKWSEKSKEVIGSPTALSTVTITGAAEVTVGGSATYSAQGFGSFGEPMQYLNYTFSLEPQSLGSLSTPGCQVREGSATFIFTAGTKTSIGTLTVQVTDGQATVTAKLVITLRAGTLTTVWIVDKSGNPVLAATTTAGGSLFFIGSGTDTYGNPVSPDQNYFWQTTVGTLTPTSETSTTLIGTRATTGTLTLTVAGTQTSIIVTILPTATTKFIFGEISSPKNINVPFEIILNSADEFDNLTVDAIITGTADLTISGSATSYAMIGLTAGFGTKSISINLPGSYIIYARGTFTQVIEGTSNPFFVEPGQPTQFIFSLPTTTTYVSAAGTTTITAYLADAGGYRVGTAGVECTLSIIGGTGTLGSLTTVTDENGQISTTCQVGTLAGSQIQVVITTTAFNGITGTSSPIITQSGSVVRFEFDKIGTQTVGVTFQIKITVRDDFGNIAAGFTSAATLTDTSNTIYPTATTNFTGGIWQGTVTITKAGTTAITSHFSLPTSYLISGTSNPFNVTPGPLAHINLIPDYATTTIEGTISFTCQGVDVYGNKIEGLTYNWESLYGTFIPTTGTSTIFTAGTLATTGTISVWAYTLESGTITAIATVTTLPGTLTFLSIFPLPATMTAGGTLTLTATGYDAYWNQLPTITCTWQTNIGTITYELPGTTAFLSATRAGTWIATATADGVATVTTIQVFAGSLHHFEFSAILDTIAGQNFTFDVDPKDQFGNATDDVTIVLGTSYKGGSVDWDGTFSSANSFLGSFTIVGTYNIIAKDYLTGTIWGTSNTFSITPATDTARFNIDLGTTSVPVAGTTSVMIKLEDVYGNALEIAGTTAELFVIGTGTLDIYFGTTNSQGIIEAVFTASSQLGTESFIQIVSVYGTQTSGTITTIVGGLNYIIIDPATVTLTVSSTKTFTAKGYDQFDNLIPELVFNWSYTVGSVSQVLGTETEFYAGTQAGIGSLTASYNTHSSYATITVVHGSATSLLISPIGTITTAGNQVVYEVMAMDNYGNTWTVTAETVFATDDPWGTMTNGQEIYTAGQVGTWTIAGTHTDSDVATSTYVVVEPGTLTFISIIPSPVTMTAGGTLTLTAIGYDAYGNQLPTITCTWQTNIGTITYESPGTTAFLFATMTGTGRATATINGIATSTTITVEHAPLHHFDFDYIGTQTADAGITFTAYARDEWNNLVNTYGGCNWLFMSKDGEVTHLEWSSSHSQDFNFSGGVLGPLTEEALEKSYNEVFIFTHKKDDETKRGTSNTFAVLPGPPAKFTVNLGTTSLPIGATISVMIQLTDAFGNLVEIAGTTAELSVIGTGTLDIYVGTTNDQGKIQAVFTASSLVGTESFIQVVSVYGTQTSGTITTLHGSLDHFVFEPIPEYGTMGIDFTITIRAEDFASNTVTDYNGSATLVVYQEGTPVGTISPNELKFVNGTYTGTVTITLVSGTLTISVYGDGKSGTSSPINIISTGPDHFEIGVSGTQTAGVDFPITIIARNITNGTLTEFVGTVSLYSSIGTVAIKENGNANVTGTFSEGIWSGTISLSQSGTGFITATCTTGAYGTSNLFTVEPGTLSYIIVEPAIAMLTVGGTRTFTATGYDIFYNTIPGLSFTWQSAIGSVNPTAGTQTLFSGTTAPNIGTLTAGYGLITGYATITLEIGTLSYIVVDPAMATLTVGGTRTFTATGYDIFYNTIPGLSFTWQSAIGSVNPTAGTQTLFSGITIPNIGTLTAGYGLITGYATITLEIGTLNYIVVNPAMVTLPIGGTCTFTAKGYDTYGNEVGELVWNWETGIGNVQPASGTYTLFSGTITGLTGTLTAGYDSIRGYATITTVHPARNIKHTNITPTQFTISWITDEVGTGIINYGSTPALGNIGYDDRSEIIDDVHHVTVSPLSPNTIYYYDIISHGITYNNNGNHFTVSTLPDAQALPGNPDYTWGTITKFGNPIDNSCIVYLRLQEKKTANISAEKSVLVPSHDIWYDDLRNFRNEGTATQFTYDTSGNYHLILFAEGAGTGAGSMLVDINQPPLHQPTPALEIGTDTIPPYLYDPQPAANATQVSGTTNITLHLRDTGYGVGSNTIVMKVNGGIVIPSLVGTPQDYYLVYTPSTPFEPGIQVKVSIYCLDLAPVPNTLDTAYTFTTKAGIAHFTFETIINQIVDTPFYGTITARDKYGNLIEDYSTNSVRLLNANNQLPVNFGSFTMTNGVGVGSISLGMEFIGPTCIYAQADNIRGTSNNFFLLIDDAQGGTVTMATTTIVFNPGVFEGVDYYPVIIPNPTSPTITMANKAIDPALSYVLDSGREINVFSGTPTLLSHDFATDTVMLTIFYDDNPLLDGYVKAGTWSVFEDSLRIYMLDEGTQQWRPIPGTSTIDTVSNMVTASIPHLSGTYILMGTIPSLDHFKFSYCGAAGGTISVGESFNNVIYAKDKKGSSLDGSSIVPPFNSTATLKLNIPGTISPSVITFVNGMWYENASITTAVNNVYLIVESNGRIGTSNPFNVVKLEYIVITPATATISVTGTVSFTAQGYTNLDVLILPETDYIWTVSSNLLGSFSPQTGTFTIFTAGTKTMTGTITVRVGNVITIATITVVHGSATALLISPVGATTTAGGKLIYESAAMDNFGNTWTVTAETVFAIDDPLGTMTAGKGTYTAGKAGTWTISGTYTTVGTSTYVVVKAGTPTSLTITPVGVTTRAGETVVYTTLASDTKGNTWTVTSETLFFDTDPIGNINAQGIYTAGKVGTWTIAATYNSIGTSTNVVVVAGTLTLLVITPVGTTTKTGGTVVYTTFASDIKGNTWTVTAETVFATDDPLGTMTAGKGTYTAGKAGTWTIYGTYTSVGTMTQVYVIAEELHHFKIESVSKQWFKNEPGTLTISARDKNDNLVATSTSFIIEPANIITPITGTTSADGNVIMVVTISKGGPGTITVSNGNIRGTINLTILFHDDKPASETLTTAEGNTIVVIPQGILPTDYYVIIGTLTPQLDVIKQNADKSLPPLYKSWGNTLREFTLKNESGETVTSFGSGTILVTIPYEDDNKDAYVKIDGHWVKEDTLWIYRLEGGKWVKILKQTSNRTSNFVTAEVGSLSVFVLIGQTTEQDLSKVEVYPNPVRVNKGDTEVVFDRLSEGVTIRIYTISGELVCIKEGVSGKATWDLKNDYGQAVASGVYIYLIHDKERIIKGRVAIIR